MEWPCLVLLAVDEVMLLAGVDGLEALPEECTSGHVGDQEARLVLDPQRQALGSGVRPVHLLLGGLAFAVVAVVVAVVVAGVDRRVGAVRTGLFVLCAARLVACEGCQRAAVGRVGEHHVDEQVANLLKPERVRGLLVVVVHVGLHGARLEEVVDGDDGVGVSGPCGRHAVGVVGDV